MGRWVIIVGALGMVMAGCGGDPGNGNATRDLDAVDSPVARYDWSPSDGSMDALLEGKLEMRDACLVVNPSWDNGDAVMVPVFPRSQASWDAEGEVLSYAGRDYGIGDSIWAGGGYVPAASNAEIPASCAVEAGEEVFLIQATTLEAPEG